jgi:tetratricopeptide (TPR) repeat protein
MSRSIHSNRQRLEQELKHRYEDPGQQSRHVQKLREELDTKRQIKKKVKSRRRTRSTDTPPVTPEAIPIHVRNQGVHVHYPASRSDIVEVLRRMPAEMIDGIHSITLCLGKMDQGPAGPYDDTDPFTGRLGNEKLPGVFSGKVLGCYHVGTDRIYLYAYIYAPDLPDRDMWELVLRLWMLSTLVHEVGQFRDFSTNRTRGRLVGYNEDRNEGHAIRAQAEWVPQCVVPYLEDAYPDAMRRLNVWVSHHGGTEIPLALLADAWRWDAQGRMRPVYFDSALEAFLDLAEYVKKGGEPTEIRLRFARCLHYGENYDEALRIILRVLKEQPNNLEALTLQADIYEHQERYQESEELAQRVVRADENYVHAWMVLADVYEARNDWGRLLPAARRGMAAVDESDRRKEALLDVSESQGCGGESDWRGEALLVHCARANLELGNTEDFEADFSSFSQTRQGKKYALPWVALISLRTGQYEEALWRATVGLELMPEGCRSVVLAAVRYDAAHRLGRPAEGGTLSPEDLRVLRLQHHNEWADRLSAEHGIGSD